MRERELIRAVKKKDDVAYQLLEKKYHDMFYKIINSFCLEKGDYKVSEDELYQEACIGLYEACTTFSKVKSCKFSTYVYVIVKRRIKRAFYRQLDIYKHEGISYDKYESVDKRGIFEINCVNDNAIEYSNKTYVNNELNHMISRLRKTDQKIVKLRLQDYTYEQISKILNVPKKRIDNRLQYLKRKKFFKR